ncbi:MAG: Transporter, LysE family, partial [uncultured Rubrobacteraceae bacterium]
DPGSAARLRGFRLRRLRDPGAEQRHGARLRRELRLPAQRAAHAGYRLRVRDNGRHHRRGAGRPVSGLPGPLRRPALGRRRLPALPGLGHREVRGAQEGRCRRGPSAGFRRRRRVSVGEPQGLVHGAGRGDDLRAQGRLLAQRARRSLGVRARGHPQRRGVGVVRHGAGTVFGEPGPPPRLQRRDGASARPLPLPDPGGDRRWSRV